MKYSKSAIGLLTAQYRSVLKKCWLINVGLFALGAAVATPADAGYTPVATRTVVAAGETANINNSSYTELDATNLTQGVAVDNSGTLTIENSLFDGNVLSKTGNHLSGGAIYNQGSLTVNGTKFLDNGAENTTTYTTLGGAIYNASGATLSIDNSEFIGNYTQGLKPRGGAIHSSGSATISNSIFQKNATTDTSGGLDKMASAVYSNTSGILNLINNTFGGETTADGNVGNSVVVNNSGNINIEGNTFKNNTVDKEGVIQLQGATAKGYFNGINTIESNSNSALFNWVGATTTFKDGSVTSIESNTATSSADANSNLGGGIHNESTVVFEEGSTAYFTNNKAKSGGAVYNKAGGTIDFNGDVSFDGNTDDTGANDIYNAGTINFGGTADLAGGIDGSAGTVNITGDVQVANALKNQTVNVNAGELALNAANISGSTINLASDAVLNTINNAIDNYSAIELADNSNIKVDANLGLGQMDLFSAQYGHDTIDLNVVEANMIGSSDEEVLMQLVNNGVKVNTSSVIYNWDDVEKKHTKTGIVGSGNADGKVKVANGATVSNLEVAAADTQAAVKESVVYEMGESEDFGSEVIENAHFIVEGNNQSVNVSGSFGIDNQSVVTINNATFEGTGSIDTAGKLRINDSNIDVVVNVAAGATLESDPTTFSNVVNVNGTGTFDGDLFTSTATLNNNGTANFTNITFENGSEITSTGTGTLNFNGGVNSLGASVEKNSINLNNGSSVILAAGGDIDGLALTTDANNGTIDLRNSRIDTLASTSLGSDLNVLMDIDLTADKSDSLGTISGGYGLNLQALELLALGGDHEEIQIATAGTNVALSSDVTNTLKTYYTTVSYDAGTGILTLDGKATPTIDLIGTWGTGNYIKAYNVADSANTSVGANLGYLDTQVKDNADEIASAQTAIGGINSDITVASAGNYIAAGTEVANNLTALDTQVKANADAVAATDAKFTNDTVDAIFKSVNVNNNMVVDSDGNTAMAGTLTANGLATLNGGVNVNNKMTVDTAGNTAIDGTLTANGLATLNGGINVNNKMTVAADGATAVTSLAINGSGAMDGIDTAATSGNTTKLITSDAVAQGLATKVDSDDIHGTGDGSTTFVGDVVIGEKAATTTVGTENVNARFDNTMGTVEMAAIGESAMGNPTEAAAVVLRSDGTNNTFAKVVAYEQDTSDKTTMTKFEADSAAKTATLSATYDGANEASVVAKTGDGIAEVTVTGTLKANDGINVNNKFTVDTNGAVRAANGEFVVDNAGNTKIKGALFAGANGTEFQVGSDGSTAVASLSVNGSAAMDGIDTAATAGNTTKLITSDAVAQGLATKQAQLVNDKDPAENISNVVATSIRASASASDTTLVTEKAISTALETKVNNDGNFTASTEPALIKDKTVVAAIRDTAVAVETSTAKNTVQDTALTNLYTAVNGGTYNKDDATVTGATALSTNFTATNLTAAANELLTDITVTDDGNYIKANKTAAQNLGILDTQVKANADDIASTAALVGTSSAPKAGTGILAGKTITGTAGTNNLNMVDAIAYVADNAAGLNVSNVFKGATNTFGETDGSQVIITNGGSMSVDKNLTIGKANAISSSTNATIDMGENTLTNVKGLTLTDGNTHTASLSANENGLNTSSNLTIGGYVKATGIDTSETNTVKLGGTGFTTAVTGDMTVSKDLTVGGDAAVTGDLTVSGTSTLNDVDVAGDLTVAGDTTLANTSVNGTLGVTGAATFGDPTDKFVDITSGAITVHDGTGSANVTASIANNGDITTKGALDVAGLASLDGGLNVNDVFDVNATTGAVTLTNGTNTATLTMTDIKVATEDPSNPESIANVMKVTGTGLFTGDVASEKGFVVAQKNGIDQYDVKYVVDQNGNVTSKGTLSVSDGKFAVDGDGAVKAADGKFNVDKDGAVSAANGAFTVAKDGKTIVGNDFAVTDKFTVQGSTGNTVVGGTFAVRDKFTVDTSGNVAAAGTFSAAASKFTVDGDGAVKAANGNFTVDKDGNTTVQGDLGVIGTAWLTNAQVSNDLAVAHDATVGNNFAVAGTSYLHDTVVDGTLATTGAVTVGGDLGVQGSSWLKNTHVDGDLDVSGTTKTGALTFDGTSYVAAMDQGDAAITSGTVDDQAKRTMATNATVAKTIGNLAGLYDGSATAASHGVTDVSDVASAIDTLSQNVETATGGTFAGATWTGTITTGATDYTYGATAGYNDIMSAVSQVASNVGSATTVAYNNVAADNTVNANIDALNSKVGDMNTIGYGYKNLSNGTTTQPDTVVEALQNIDASMGTIHGLAAKLKSEGKYQGNLAEGTTVENHLTALDTAIGDRSRFNNMHYTKGAKSVVDAVGKLDNKLSGLDHDVRVLRHKFQSGMASAAALSALVPNARAHGNTQLSLGTGMYHGHGAMAIGGFHWFSDNLLFNTGIAWDDNEATYRMGVTYSW